jgi:uncharacterized damage-inducible protein DinB
MKNYLLDYWKYNNWASQKFFQVLAELPEKEEVLKLFSHLVAAQDKWMNRITRHKDDSHYSWNVNSFRETEIPGEWERSFNEWKELLENSSDEQLEHDIIFYRAADGKAMKLKLRELVFHLNCHAVHHRAQAATLISRQGVKPPSADYIFSVLREG